MRNFAVKGNQETGLWLEKVREFCLLSCVKMEGVTIHLYASGNDQEGDDAGERGALLEQ